MTWPEAVVYSILIICATAFFLMVVVSIAMNNTKR